MNQVLLGDEVGDPIDVLVGDHFRIRAMLNLLTDCARATMPAHVRSDLLRSLVTFLVLDLPRHLTEEEELLFPRLQRRLRPSDVLDPSVRSLRTDHLGIREAAARLVDEAARIQACTPPVPTPEFRAMVARFVTMKQRHVAAENAAVLPLARHRLKAVDLSGIGRGLAHGRSAPSGPSTWATRWLSTTAGRC
ncbi:MAG: hemerythrin domain-containing protein [Alphaproteobacteria bacterium]|nr:hemerythrin domain-containing protein [Alphaproteobacteria bacterium]